MLDFEFKSVERRILVGSLADFQTIELINDQEETTYRRYKLDGLLQVESMIDQESLMKDKTKFIVVKFQDIDIPHIMDKEWIGDRWRAVMRDDWQQEDFDNEESGFEWAMVHMKSGMWAQLPEWGDDVYIKMFYPNEMKRVSKPSGKFDDDGKEIYNEHATPVENPNDLPLCIALVNADGSMEEWRATTNDLLAENWKVKLFEE